MLSMERAGEICIIHKGVTVAHKQKKRKRYKHMVSPATAVELAA